LNTLVIHGAGFVGSALYLGFQGGMKEWKFKVYDKDKENSLLYKTCPSANFVDREEALCTGDIHFVCVPTPMNPDGSPNTSIVEDVIRSISELNAIGCDIVIKSTVPPGFTKNWANIHPRLFFNPEFLTEANYIEDFTSLQYQFLGNPGSLRSKLLKKLYVDGAKERGVLGGKGILEIDSTEAEMIKITRNCYLATRLSFFNEIKQVCDKLGVNYDSMRFKAGMDERIGVHYSKVPGPDGKLGWSLSCLPKDLNDFIYLAKSLGVDPKVAIGVWEKNLEVRPERDWENMSKAVTKS
jgi:UDPglucose 6-dehydrogenase